MGIPLPTRQQIFSIPSALQKNLGECLGFQFASFLSSEDGSNPWLPGFLLFFVMAFSQLQFYMFCNNSVSLLCRLVFQRYFCFCLMKVIQIQTWSRKNMK